MQTERWQRIEKLFHAALERTPNERAAFLADASARDEELRREVESLLATTVSSLMATEMPNWSPAVASVAVSFRFG